MSRSLAVLESPLKSESIVEVNARRVDTEKFPLLRLLDPSLKWYVYPAMDFRLRVYGDVTGTNQTLYLCDDALCFPVRFSGYLSWFDSSANNVGNKVFDNVREDWDHTNESNPTQDSWVIKGYLIIGYRGYFVAIIVTDGTNKLVVYVSHRYTDGAVLIYNTGKYGTSTVNVTVRVNDPPSGLGYSVSTNGTRGSGYTDIAPGQYVLFYKGTAPSIDATNGIFSSSTIGSSKSQPYELYAPSNTLYNMPIPTIYTGIKSDKDYPLLTNGYLLNIFINGYLPMSHIQAITRTPINASSYFTVLHETFLIHLFYNDDPYCSAGTWSGGIAPFKVWSGWAEDDNGNVKFIVYSIMLVKHNTKWERRYIAYSASIYDVERGEMYRIGITKPLVNIYSYGKNGNVCTPFTVRLAADIVQASAIGFIDQNDSYTKSTSPVTTCWVFTDNIYGFCNYYGDKGITCVEGLAIYTDDPDISITNSKSVWRANQCSNAVDKVGSQSLSPNPFGDRTLKAGKLYVEVVRVKAFPSTTSDNDIVNWFKSITPKVLTSGELSGILSILPFSLYLYGENKDTVSITAPSSVNPNSTFNVTVSCPARAGRSVWVALVDSNGKVVASASGTLDSSGNATLSLTAPSTTGTYKIIAIVAGSRTLP